MRFKQGGGCRIAAALLVAWLSVAAGAEARPAEQRPKLAREAANADGFVPRGWRLEAQASGDLNGDGRPDIAFIVRGDDRKKIIPATRLGGESSHNANPRIFALAFQSASGRYRLQLQDNRFIASPPDPISFDPLVEGSLRIESGRLRIRFASGSFEARSITHMDFAFECRNGRFELVLHTVDEVVRWSGESTEVAVDYDAGEITITRWNAREETEEDQTSRPTEKRRLPPGRRPALPEIGKGDWFRAVPGLL